MSIPSQLKYSFETHNNSSNKTPEKVGSASHNDSLQLSPISDEISKETTPIFIEQVNSELNHNFKCEYCDTTTVSQHALKEPKDFYHTPNLPHTSDWKENKCHICNKHFNYTFEFKSNMINEHSFSEEIAVCYLCDESTDRHFNTMNRPGLRAGSIEKWFLCEKFYIDLWFF